MRLKIELTSKELKLPINYQATIQGMIYSVFSKEDYGKFLHDEGYRLDNKVFKLFVFSNLFGKYRIDNKKIIFEDKCYFYIASESEEFIQIVYQFYMNNEIIILDGQKVKINNIKMVDVPYFRGEKDIVIRTLSPVVAYRTENNYVNYFKPSDEEFALLCFNNLLNKNASIDNPISNLVFSINSINYEKKRLVRFKNTFYIAYMSEMNIHTNYETLSLLYNTGLSSKGSAGFGMIEVKA